MYERQNKNDIILRIRLIGYKDNVDAKLLIQTLDSIETAIYRVEREIIQEMKEEQIIPKFAGDACLERLRNFRHNRFLLKNADKGSIILEGALAATLLWVLKNTLGEMAKEGFKESSLYLQGKDKVRDSVNSMTSKLYEYIRKEMFSRKRRFRLKQPEEKTLDLEVLDTQKEYDELILRSLGEELDENDNF
ncbi:hypothetical protein [Phaeodactylibacter xiamenensis]|uniref:hypothetical protein n=1 Tax=Phaeodactylibacter xiamenensis TaxID=1524460 RepID=UPI003BA94A3E